MRPGETITAYRIQHGSTRALPAPRADRFYVVAELWEDGRRMDARIIKAFRTRAAAVAAVTHRLRRAANRE